MEEAEGSVEATSEPVVVASAGASRIEGGVAGREGGVASLVDKVLQRLHSSEGGAGGRKTAPVKAAKKTAKKFIKTTAKPKKTVEVNKVVKQRIKPRMAVGLKAPKARVGAGRGTAQAALLALQELRTAATWVQCGLQGCGRWRLLEEQDPAAVGRRWKCADHPDPALRQCSAPEQPWAPPSGSAAWVENRFTVGSLVWAGLAGWPSWPAMVDDDPDVGEFFWTEVAAGEWEARPTHYHVVFFDQKAVSRAWVADGRLTTFPGGLELRGPDRSNARLRRAVAAAGRGGGGGGRRHGAAPEAQQVLPGAAARRPLGSCVARLGRERRGDGRRPAPALRGGRGVGAEAAGGRHRGHRHGGRHVHGGGGGGRGPAPAGRPVGG